LKEIQKIPRLNSEQKSLLNHLIENKKVQLFYTPKKGPISFN